MLSEIGWLQVIQVIKSFNLNLCFMEKVLNKVYKTGHENIVGLFLYPYENKIDFY
jgi:hypothetical protein